MAIVKILKSSSSFAAVSYNEKRCKNGEAILLSASNFSLPPDVLPYSESLKLWSSKNKRIKNPQFHAVISLKDNSLSKEELLRIANEWLEKMGYAENPTLIYFHSNTNHPHVHIVTSRIDKNGKKIDDSFEKERALKHLHSIEGINQTEENRKILFKLLHYSFSTKYQFLELCKSSGFKAELTDDDIVCKKGESIIHLSHELIDFCSKRYQKDISVKEKKKIQSLIYKYATLLPRDKFSKFMLDKFGLKFIFYGKQNDINGYTVIDFKNQSVYKGSQIFGMNKLSELLEVPPSPIFNYELSILELLELYPHTSSFTINSHLLNSTHFTIRNGQFVNTKTGETFSMDKSLSDKLIYNDRLNFFVNHFNPYDEKSIRIISRLGQLRYEDVKNLSPGHLPDHQTMIDYKSILDDALKDTSFLRFNLSSKHISLYFEKDDFYILDSLNHRVVSASSLGLDFDDFKNRIDNEVDEDLIFEHDNVPAFEFIDIPSFDLDGLIFAGKVGGARNNRKKKRSS